MSSNKDKVIHKIDTMADSAKHAAVKIVDDVTDVAADAAAKANKQLHEAGKQLRDAGAKIMKQADKR
ncbi:MAG TPA: hypothetical protein VMV51_10510 [Gemmatimonadaceae bacterium]|nr:hypothetical protein [Gemmatimonadaceae bacterium]